MSINSPKGADVPSDDLRLRKCRESLLDALRARTILGKEKCDKPFELSESLLKELEPFVQYGPISYDTHKPFGRRIERAQKDYILVYNAESASIHMERFMYFRFGNLDEDNKRLTQWLNNRLRQRGILDELAALRAKNQQEATRANLVLIPQLHPADPREEGSDQTNHFYRQQIAASAENITGILGVLNRYGPKIAVEGEIIGRKMDEMEIVEMTKRIHSDDPKAVLRIERRVANDKKDRPWLYDKEYETHGMESGHLRAMLYTFDAACRNDVKCDPMLRQLVDIVFKILIRQQFAIETSLQRLNEAELGVIIMGLSHIPTMRQYLAENHPNTKVETIIPKFQ